MVRRAHRRHSVTRVVSIATIFQQFAFMPSAKKSIKPRKIAVQSRSTHTVRSILEATTQVLLAVGSDRLTTSRVAERAGVSIGTLYQYFPNKEALLSGALRQHLSGVVEAIERACEEAAESSLERMAKAVVGAFVEAKLRDAPTSRALYAVAADVGGAEVVAEMTARSQAALLKMLESSSDCRLSDPDTVVYVWASSMVGPVQGLLQCEEGIIKAQVLREHLERMAVAYLRSQSINHLSTSSQHPADRR